MHMSETFLKNVLDTLSQHPACSRSVQCNAFGGNARKIMHNGLLPPGQTTDFNLYCQQLTEE